jgi:hypothetical protein
MGVPAWVGLLIAAVFILGIIAGVALRPRS